MIQTSAEKDTWRDQWVAQPLHKLCFQRTALHYGAKGWELFDLGIPLDSDCQVHICKTTQFMSESHSPGSD